MWWPAHHSFCDQFKGWSELFPPLLLSNVAQGVPHKSRIPTPCFCELGQSLRYLGRGMSRCQSQKPKSRNFKYNVWKRLHIERDGKKAGLTLLTEKNEKRRLNLGFKNKGFFKIKLTRGTKVKLIPKKMTNVTLWTTSALLSWLKTNQ